MHYLTQDEVRAVLSQARTEQMRLAFAVAYWHGLRASEICGPKGLTGASIRDGYVAVQRLKGSKRTRQPYIVQTDPLLDESAALQQYAKTFGPHQALFPFSRKQFHYAFQQAARKAGLPVHKQHPHCLKHSIAKHLIKPAGIEYTRQWLGHTNISSTGHYLEVDDESTAQIVLSIVGGK